MVIPILVVLMIIGSAFFYFVVKNLTKKSPKKEEVPQTHEDLTLVSQAKELEQLQQQAVKRIDNLSLRDKLFQNAYSKTFPERVEKTIKDDEKNQEEASQIEEAQKNAQASTLLQAPAPPSTPPQEESEKKTPQKERLKEETEENIRKKLKSCLSYNREQRQRRNSTIQ